MATVDDVVHGEQGRGSGASPWMRPWAAEILATPAAIGGELFVRIPGIDRDKRFGPCAWSPLPAGGGKYTIPGGSEDCIVAFDDNKLPWVLQWTPYSGSVILT